MPVRIPYVDESIRPRHYWLGVALVPGPDVPALARLVRSLHLPGQRQLHLKSERDSRRRLIIGEIMASGLVRGWIYRAPRPVVQAREVCLRALVSDVVDAGADQLILDRVDEQQATRDRATIRESLQKSGGHVRYRHAPPWEHAGVQVADVIAWAYGAGGDWKRRIGPLIDKAVGLGS